MTNKTVFRVTVYHPTEDFCAILDTFDFTEKLWEFSAFLIQKGFKIIDATNSDKFLDVNITPTPNHVKRIIVRACDKGQPEKLIKELDGKMHNAIRVNTRIYIPDRAQ